MKKRGTRGAVMLETVILLPVILIIIFYLLQMIFVLLAKEVTYYAAYCGARAALVYNPADYADTNRVGSGGGVVGEAACTVLSWISQSVEGSEPLKIAASEGDYEVPRSENIRNQVSVKIVELLNKPSQLRYDDTIVYPMGGDMGRSNSSSNIYATSPNSEFPIVRVTVTFKCPLLIPLGGRIFAGLANSPFQSEAKDTVSTFAEVVAAGAAKEDKRGWLYNYIEVQETCSLAKPYNTATFPLVPEDDKYILRGAR